ncbi:DinB family protein [Cytophagaceae bacterium DM2B3-1]|uniref:DinB family protein n=1 Tax=Xanthocytophaga flava TaxID=3048013 RepID=A0ABT7CP41_9BACT|nr:DinB family protein [Xanthocytophaga flavus]MDJ1466306.1 DinB family protein [Xanthocytophaga flavus]MDJ1495511.1 DinB family protein [Xanthocytophaga flavus]
MLQTSIELAESSLVSLSRDYANYNAWANKQLINWLQAKPAQLMEVEVASSFPSVHLTVWHILQTQQWWLGNLKRSPLGNTRDTTFDGTTQDMMQTLLQQSEEFCAFVENMTEEDLYEMYPFNIPYVGDFSRSGFEIVQHCMNHSTYHRGQLVTIGRELGFTDAPMTDYMFYLLMA